MPRTQLTIGGVVAPSAIMRRLSAPRRQAVIRRNPRTFRQGGTIAEAQLRRWYSIPTPDFTGLSTNDTLRLAANYNLCLVGAYTDFNKLLTRRGLVIKKTGNVYNILSLTGARARVTGLRAESTHKALAAIRLCTGIVRHQGIFTSLTDAELQISQ